MSFSVEPVWSWPVVLAAAAALVTVVLVTQRAAAARLTPGRHGVLLGLRLTAAVLLIWAMFRPVLQISEVTEGKAQLLILADASRSMNTADGPGGKSRWTASREDLAELDAAFADWGQKLEVRHFEFGKELTPRDPAMKEGTADFTAIGAALEALQRETRNRRTLGVLLLTDGAQRAIPPFDVDPLLAARKLGEQQAPIYPVGYGTATLSESSLDLAVEDLLVDPVVFEKKQVPVTVRLRALGAAGRKVAVRLLIEDRNGRRLGESGELIPAQASGNARPATELEITQPNQVVPVELSFIPDQPGELKLAVEAIPADGELLVRNNLRQTVITVRQGGLRVAYFDTLRPEQKLIRTVNGAEQIQLDYYQVWGQQFRNRTQIPDAAFERNAYDIYIIGDVPAGVFGANHLRELANRLDEGAGLMMTGGLLNYSAGGYAATFLADFLPVELNRPAGRPGAANPNEQITDRVQMLPTQLGARRYVMQLAPPERNSPVWQSLPPLDGATRLTPKRDNPLIEVWAETPQQQPLLIATEVGRSRVIAFGGDTTWLWFSHHPEEHQRFWRQVIVWLAHKEEDTSQPVWVKVEPRNVLAGSPVQLTFGARSADGKPLPDAAFSVELLGPERKPESLPPRRGEENSSASWTASGAAGDYWVKVAARQGETSVGLDAWTRFIIDDRDLELDQPAADYELLRQLGSLSGGKLLAREELPEWLKSLRETRFEDLTRLTSVTLYDNWWLLAAFVAVVSLEWFWRKKWGLV